MPELPEVESLRLGLEKVLIGQKILKIQILNQKIIASNSNKRSISKKKTLEFLEKITNTQIKNIWRRAKNLIIELDNQSIILIHLKMTGQLVFVNDLSKTTTIQPYPRPLPLGGEKPKIQKIIGGHPIIESYKDNLPNKHTQIIFELNKGKLFYNDVRKFGYVLYYKNLAEAIKEKHWQKLGLEPLAKDFTIKYFKEKIKALPPAPPNRRGGIQNKKIKTVLLEQSVVVGCGNIYTDEICFASKVLPQKICKNLSDKEISSLYKNIKLILNSAIRAGGSSVNNYLLADGSKGNYAKQHKVYGKAGLPCSICQNILQKIIINARSTVFCGKCQR